MRAYKLKDIISQGTKDLFYIWWQELKAVVKDQGVLIFFILVPLGYPLLYTFIYTNETVREVPAAVVDNNRSSLSREYLRLVDAGADLEIVSHCSDMEEAKTLLKNGKVYGIIYIPESFSRDITKGVQTHVTIYCDMSGMLYYKAMLTANTNASLMMNKQIKIERSGNTTIRQDEVSTSPIAYEDISIFNPQNGFASFLIPAVLILIIQQTLLLGVGLSAGTARENNRFRDLIPMSRHYHGTLRIVLGKSLTYLMIYAVMATYMLCLVPKMFSLVQIDDRLVILVAYKQIVSQSAQSKHQQGKPYDGRYVIPGDRYFANDLRSEELFGMQRVYRNGIYFYGQCFGPVRLSVYHHLEWGEIVKCRVKRGYCIFLFYQHTFSIVQHLGIRLGYIQYLHSFYQCIA